MSAGDIIAALLLGQLGHEGNHVLVLVLKASVCSDHERSYLVDGKSYGVSVASVAE